METLNRPEMHPLAKGETFKTLQVNVKGGLNMPTHHTTKEAVIMVQKGEALLKTPEGDYEFSPGTTFILPAQLKHSLQVKKDFQAIVVLALDSEIEFEN